jgi:hypothetical protein
MGQAISLADGVAPRQTDEVPTERRPSLSSEQVRDPLGTLALAYGVERHQNAVWVAIAQRLYPDDRYVVWDKEHPLEVKAEWRALGLILAILEEDGRFLARVVRGSQLPKPLPKHFKQLAAGCAPDTQPEVFIEQIFSEIRSAVMPYARGAGQS